MDLFLESEILGENEKSFYIGGLNFNSIIGNDVFYRISEKETGEIAVIKSRGKESGSSEILDQILATFKFSESNFENWKEYNDTTGDVSFKYPAALNESEDLGQFVFRDKYPGGFSFYFFSIEPQIDNLEKWIQESPVNLEEEMEKYEYKSFGDAILGVYYEAKAKQADSAEDAPDTQDTRSFGYIFNHYGATYFLRTNKDNFQKTFKNVLDSIKFNFLDEEQDLNFESN
ncbi:MAG: hypothetical protein ABIC82_04245 [bacterium]